MTNDNNLAPPGAFNSILSEIAAERERQIAKGYTAESDDKHEPWRLVFKAGLRMPSSVQPTEERRRKLIQAAALLVAEAQRIDRAKVAGNG